MVNLSLCLLFEVDWRTCIFKNLWSIVSGIRLRLRLGHLGLYLSKHLVALFWICLTCGISAFFIKDLRYSPSILYTCIINLFGKSKSLYLYFSKYVSVKNQYPIKSTCISSSPPIWLSKITPKLGPCRLLHLFSSHNAITLPSRYTELFPLPIIG